MVKCNFTRSHKKKNIMWKRARPRLHGKQSEEPEKKPNSLVKTEKDF